MSYRVVDQMMDVLREIRRQEQEWEIFVWDNRSDASELIEERLLDSGIADWTHFSSSNEGFARAVNGIAGAGGEWDVLLLINPDAVICGPLRILTEVCMKEGTAAVGCWVDGAEDAPWANVYDDVGPVGLAVRGLVGRRLESIPAPDRSVSDRPVDGWITGSLLALTRSAWAKAGPFDERFFLYSEEQDWQRRARRAGFAVRQVNQVLASHVNGGTVAGDESLARRSQELQEESRRLYIRKWWGRLGLGVYVFIMEVGRLIKGLSRPLRGLRG